MFEKRWHAVTPQPFIANGGTDGAIQIALNACSLFKVKMQVLLNATSLPEILVEIKRIDLGVIYVGPISTPITTRSDISAYTIALSASISANEQLRSSVPEEQIERLTYEEEPTVARRVVIVDECGNKINDLNPLPVAATFDGDVKVGDIRITACDDDPKPGDKHSSIRISDCANDLKINADGSINVVVESVIPEHVNNILISYNESAPVATGVSTTILTYFAPIGQQQTIARAIVSGENIARYDIAVNSVIIATQRTYFGGDLSKTIEFAGSDGNGFAISPGDVVTIKVIHNRPNTSIFEATLELSVGPAFATGETPVFVYNEINAAVTGTTYGLATYTVMPGRVATLQRIIVSGENIARYDVFVNAGPVATQRTYFGGDLDNDFEFYGSDGGGLPLAVGDVVTVKVLHNRPNPASFEATIEVLEFA